MVLSSDIENLSFDELFTIYKHHCQILSRASEVRLLNSYELDFMTLLPSYEVGFITLSDFRRGCLEYLYS